jgi:hypothetical protein
MLQELLAEPLPSNDTKNDGRNYWRTTLRWAQHDIQKKSNADWLEYSKVNGEGYIHTGTQTAELISLLLFFLIR